MTKIDILLDAIRTAKTPEEKREIVCFVRTLNSEDFREAGITPLEFFKSIDETFAAYQPEDYQAIKPIIAAGGIQAFQGIDNIQTRPKKDQPKKDQTTWELPEIEDGKPTKYGWVVRHPENFKLAPNTDIGFGTYIQAKNGVIIEEGVLIGSHCSIYSISTINDKAGVVVLKKNCRIGSHSIIMPGVTIGENSVVGAFSYVTHDVPPNKIVFYKQVFTIKDRE